MRAMTLVASVGKLNGRRGPHGPSANDYVESHSLHLPPIAQLASRDGSDAREPHTRTQCCASSFTPSAGPCG